MTRGLSFISFFFLFFLFSCSGDKPGTSPQVSPERGNAGEPAKEAPPSPSADAAYSLELGPGEATRTSTLYLVPRGFSLADARVEWLVNGSPVAAGTPKELSSAELKKGDVVQARARLKNGGVVPSNTVQMKNSPPGVRLVKNLPASIKPGDTLSVEATGGDADGDEVTLSYEWTINGEPAGKTSRLEAKAKRGDNISVKITPFDGEAYGSPVILEREIANIPPIIVEDKKFHFDGKVWTYQVRATDPDNDPLTYSLKSGPAGMTIDSSGFIKWNVPADFKGKAAVSVSVSDGHGGQAVYNFNVNMSTEPRK